MGIAEHKLKKQAEDTKQQPRVQSVARAVGILHSISTSATGLSRKEISEQNDLTKQTTYHLLHTLSQFGLVRKNEFGDYILGLRVTSLAEGFRRQHEGSPQIFNLVKKVAKKTGETAYAAKWIDGEVVSIARAPGWHPIQAVQVPQGLSTDAHARAGGKVLLAFSSDIDRQRFFETHKLTRRTPKTIYSKEELEAQFKKIRACGYAVEKEEFAEGLCCLALPLDGGFSPYAIGISAPVDRFEKNFKFLLEHIKEVTQFSL